MTILGSKSPQPLLIALTLGTMMSPGWLSAQRVSFGFVGGTNITRDFPISRSAYQDSRYPAGLTTFDLFSNTHSLIAGFSVETEIRRNLSFEVDALYRNLNLQARFLFPDGSQARGQSSNVTTWEFPILLKYRLSPVRGIRPFVEAGHPSALATIRGRQNHLNSELPPGPERIFRSGDFASHQGFVIRDGSTTATIPESRLNGTSLNS